MSRRVSSQYVVRRRDIKRHHKSSYHLILDMVDDCLPAWDSLNRSLLDKYDGPHLRLACKTCETITRLLCHYHTTTVMVVAVQEIVYGPELSTIPRNGPRYDLGIPRFMESDPRAESISYNLSCACRLATPEQCLRRSKARGRAMGCRSLEMRGVLLSLTS
jgi:hypothetical protein